MDNQETPTILDTQDTGQISVRENRSGNQDWTIKRHNIGHTGQISVRENRSGNREWTIKRHWQHWTHKTYDK